MQWIKTEYDNFPVLITENGVSDRNGSLDDQHRVYFYKHYINNVLQGKLRQYSSLQRERERKRERERERASESEKREMEKEK